MRGKRVKWLREKGAGCFAGNFTLQELKDWWTRGHLKWQMNLGRGAAPNRYLG